MILSWMLYGVVAAALVAIGGCAAESLARGAAYPVRWIWTGAIVLSLLLLAVAPTRGAHATPMSPPSALEMAAAATPGTSGNWRDRIVTELNTIARALEQPLRAATVTLRRAETAAATRLVICLWVAITTSLMAAIVGGQARIRRARRRWPVTDLHGMRVRLAPGTGPIVVGLARPEIVVPRWLLARTALEQRLVIAHEAEHVRAFDTLLLAASCVALALVPWCVPLWYMFSRLRLAVELDCDARVLRAGAAPQSYGSLLIDVAEHASDFHIGATALVAGPSHLQRRLMAMQRKTPRFPRARAVGATALCSLALLAACEAKMPTAAEVAALDASSAEVQAKRLASAQQSGNDIKFVVDGSTVPREQAMKLKPTEIATVNVRKSPQPGQSEIDITTLAATRAQVDSSAPTVRVARGRAPGDTSLGASMERLAAGTPMMFIDGVRATQAQFKALDPKSIESIEVVKGKRAAEEYSDPGAANGVITVTTKKPDTR